MTDLKRLGHYGVLSQAESAEPFMWKAITLVASAFLFSTVGTVAVFLSRGDAVWGAGIGGVAGFVIGYLAIVIAVSSERAYSPTRAAPPPRDQPNDLTGS